VASSGFSFGMKSSSAESKAAMHAVKLSAPARNNFTTSSVSQRKNGDADPAATIREIQWLAGKSEEAARRHR
jgi:hypothetical protein